MTKNTKTTAIEFTDAHGFQHRAVRTGRNTAETFIRSRIDGSFIKAFDRITFTGGFTAHNINNAVVIGER